MATTFLALPNTYVATDVLPAADVVGLANAAEARAASRTAINLAGTGTYTLSSTEYRTEILDCSGILTGARTLQVPLTAGAHWVVNNACTGAFDVTVKGSSGTGPIVPQGGSLEVWTDGTNVYAHGALGLTGVHAAYAADKNVIGALPVLHRVDVAAGATGDVDTTLTHKTRVTEVWLVKKSAAGGGAGTIQVKNGASAITDAMSINVADQTVVRCTTIDDAQWEIAAAGTLRCTRTRTASTDETCTVYVLGLRVT
jgi:hypothetical protein